MLPLLLMAMTAAPVAVQEPLELTLRSRADDAASREQRVRWDAARTAAIVCDMWDRHWCAGATARVGEMAPRIDAVLQNLRDRGALVVHAPSDTLDAYAGTVQRRRAIDAPPATPPIPIRSWCSLDREREGELPIDDSNGGCDCEPRCATGRAWSRQTEAIRIADADAISDRGDEIYNLLRAHDVEHVLVLGVHTNMCVLGRPFGIRQLVRLGFDVALVRDLTDTMYDSRSRPWVSHFRGTDLVVEHIERHWCPTVHSGDVLGGDAFRFRNDRRARIALVIAEDEYDAARTLPQFAGDELAHRFGFEIDVLTESKRDDMPSLERLAEADLAVLFLRRRTLPERQLELLRKYLATNRPLIALRTASHGFENWPAFDPEVLGGHYRGHHGNRGEHDPATSVQAVEVAEHPILRGAPRGEFTVRSWLYKVSPLEPDARVLMRGRVGDREPHEPVAWVRVVGGRRVFYTSLGHPDDFDLPAFRRMLVNAVFWGLERPPPRWRPPPAEPTGDRR